MDVSGFSSSRTPKFPHTVNGSQALPLYRTTWRTFSNADCGGKRSGIWAMSVCISQGLMWYWGYWSQEHILRTMEKAAFPPSFLVWRRFRDSFSFYIQPKVTILSFYSKGRSNIFQFLGFCRKGVLLPSGL